MSVFFLSGIFDLSLENAIEFWDSLLYEGPTFIFAAFYVTMKQWSNFLDCDEEDINMAVKEVIPRGLPKPILEKDDSIYYYKQGWN